MFVVWLLIVPYFNMKYNVPRYGLIWNYLNMIHPGLYWVLTAIIFGCAVWWKNRSKHQSKIDHQAIHNQDGKS